MVTLTLLGQTIWEDRYALKDKDGKLLEKNIDDNFLRVAKAVASKEERPAYWTDEFHKLMSAGYFCPAGRILANSGTHYSQLLNCFVLPFRDDSLEEIMHTASDMAVVQKHGGGTGFNYSRLRPAGSYIRGVNGRSCGVIGFMDMMNTVSEVIEQGGSRRGASLGLLEVWHPDVWEFISYKSIHNWDRMLEFMDVKDARRWDTFKYENPYKWQMYNVSVGVNDGFLTAVNQDEEWPFIWKDTPWQLYTVKFMAKSGYEEAFEVTANCEETAIWKAKKKVPYPGAGDKFVIAKIRTIKAKELWDRLCYNAWVDGCPGLINLSTVRKMHPLEYVHPVESANPCAEQMLPAGAVCLLGSLVLDSFVYMKDEKPQIDYETINNTVKVAVRFMDNVIDNCDYPFQYMKDMEMSERRIGLGTMGVHDMLMKLGYGYDTEEGRDIVGSVLRTIVESAYGASVEIAKEKGSFPALDKEKYLNSGFIRTLPLSLREDIAKYGIRNGAILSQAPTGCLVGNSLIPTSGGVRPIKAISDNRANKWVRLEKIAVSNDFGKTGITQFYNNGLASTIRLVTNKGYELEGTVEHKVRVLSDGNGYTWKKLQDISVGDRVVLKKGFIQDKETWLKEDVSYLLGYYMADGWWSSSELNPNTHSRGYRLYFSINPKETGFNASLRDKIVSTWGSTFKITPDRLIGREDRECGVYRLETTNVKLYRWFEKYGCVKNGAINTFIPEIVLSSSVECICAFIRGYFDGDGCFQRTKKNISFKTISPTMAHQLQVILLGLGIPSSVYSYDTPVDKKIHIGERELKSFNTSYTISVDRGYVERLCNLLKISAPFSFVSRTEERVPVFADELSKFCLFPLESDTDKYSVTIGTYKKNVPEENWNWFVKNNLMFDYVKSIEGSSELVETFDISVADVTHTYIANGFVTHNTIATMLNKSTGCEPWFDLAYQRKTRLGSYEDGCDTYLQWRKANPSKEQPSYFKTSQEIKPEDHIAMMALFNKYVDSAVSKTCNLPNSATVGDVSKIYLMAMSQGVKGVTVFRDGCKQGVLSKKKTKKEEACEDARSMDVSGKEERGDSRLDPHMRGNRTVGATTRVNMQSHNMYVTVNRNGDDHIVEVFATVGESKNPKVHHTSGVEDSWAEALAKIISLALRAGVDPQSIIRNLRNIPSDKPVFTTVGNQENSELIPSPPHAIARVMEEEFNYTTHSDKIQIKDRPRDGEKCRNCGSSNLWWRTPTCYECKDCNSTSCT